MTQKFVFIFILIFFSQISFAQDTLPKFSITKNNGHTFISWVNLYTNVTSISIQRSADSTKNFKTISSISDIKKQQNSFSDPDLFNPKLFYRLFISFEGGNYLYTRSYRSKEEFSVKPLPEKPAFSGTIKGIVIDSSTNYLLDNVTITLTETGEEQGLKNILSKEDGSFEISALSKKRYRLIISNAGYKTKILQVPYFNSAVIDLGKIFISSAAIQLKEVEVVKKKTLIEQDVDKLTYHVDADPESRTITALDMLRKVPMITIDAEDNVQLNGSSNYLILINGKTSSLFVRNPSDIFKGMPASTIKDIEVITNPPSKYESQGVGGIINLITYKKNIGGYNGSVNLTESSPKGFAATAYVSAKAGKFNISANAGANNYTNPINSSNFFREDNVRKNKLRQIGENTSKNNLNNLGVEISYEADSANMITGSFNINSSKGTNTFRQQAALTDSAGSIKEENLFLNNSSSKWNGNDVSLNYQRSFKKKDQSFSASYKFTNSVNANPSDFTRTTKSNNYSQENYTDNNGLLREHTLQADYVQPVKKQILEVGIKSTLSFNSSDYFYKNQDSATGVFIIDPAQSDNFEYQQNIYAAYASLNYKKNNWGIRTGARLEQTSINATFKSSGTSAKQNYVNLMPNITLSRKLKGTGTVRLSYSQRIDRPILSYLNPYVYSVDPRNISYGNPALHAAISNVFNLSYNTFFNGSSITAGIFYHYTNNSVEQFTTLSADLIARTTYGNIAVNRTTGFSLSGNTTVFKKLNFNLNTTSGYVKYLSKYVSRPQSGLTFNATGYASYSFNKGWRASGNIGYSSSNILLQGKAAGYTWNTFSVFKDFLQDNRTTFSFTVSSPFQKNRRLFTELYDPAFHQLQESYLLIRRFSLSFNYRFAKVQGEVGEKPQ